MRALLAQDALAPPTEPAALRAVYQQLEYNAKAPEFMWSIAVVRAPYPALPGAVYHSPRPSHQKQTSKCPLVGPQKHKTGPAQLLRKNKSQ